MVRLFGVDPGAGAGYIILMTFLQIAVGYPLLTAGAELSLRVFPSRWPLVLRLAAGCVLAAPVVAACTLTATWIAGVPPPHLQLGDDRAALYAHILRIYPRVTFALSIAATLFWMMNNYHWYEARLLGAPAGNRRARAPAQALAALRADAGAPPLFLEKLPPHKRGDLWAVSAERHYLRVYTHRGDDLILMRFSDALDELRRASGLQIHRSHWVSAKGVSGLETLDDRLHVVLKNGAKLPVSRPNTSAVRAALSAEALAALQAEAAGPAPGETAPADP